MKLLIEKVGNIKKKQDREFAESVLEISMQANLELIKELLQGDDSMNEALLEVMSPLIEPQLLLREKRGIEQGELLHLIKTIYKKMLKGKTNEEISDEVEEDITTIEQIKEIILEYKKKHKDKEFDSGIFLKYFKMKSK